MIPDAYELKRIVRGHRARFWSADLLDGFEHAPIYFFTDQEAFDSEQVDRAMDRVLTCPIRLPHPSVIFEVREQGPAPSGLIVYACQQEDRVEAVFVLRKRAPRGWSDCLVRISLEPGGKVEIEGNPGEPDYDTVRIYGEIAAGVVWRALTILETSAEVRDRKVCSSKRARLAREGLRGWVWRQVTIDPARLRAATEPQGGTHASPRWHIRRGHWRQLADGRRVFVRQCEVGDPTIGGVVKDYAVEAPAA